MGAAGTHSTKPGDPVGGRKVCELGKRLDEKRALRNVGGKGGQDGLEGQGVGRPGKEKLQE